MIGQSSLFGRKFGHDCVASMFAALLFGALVSDSSLAAEKWADTRLTVQEGLELWLDAAQAAGEGAVADNAELKEWLDASGKGRHLKQPDKKARPKLIKVGGIGIVRFDGNDDHLRAVKQAATLDSFTIFIVASPRQNIGSFRAFLALNAANERDYTSGLNIDLGPSPTAQFSVINVEGRGFGGVQNLLTRESTFARLHTLAISSDATDKTVRLIADGQNEGQRNARWLADQLRRDHGRRTVLQQRQRRTAARWLRPDRHRRSSHLQPRPAAGRTREACTSISKPSTNSSRTFCRPILS